MITIIGTGRYGMVPLESPLTIPARPHSHGLRSANSHLADKTKRRYRLDEDDY